MREIKFRAWVRDEYMMYSGVHKGLDYLEFGSNGKVIIGEGDGDQRYEDIPLMQYTGLKDKNGKEIYEGDVILHSFGNKNSTYTQNTSIVIWENCYYILDSMAGWWTKEVKTLSKEILSNTQNKVTFKVIGNIYENPNLIKNE